MTIEFDEFSRDGQPDEVLPKLPSNRRRWVTISCACGVALVLGAGVALAATGASASTGLAVAASSVSSSAAPKATGTGAPTDHRRGLRFPGGPLQPSLFGTVKSLSDGKILITDLQGFTRTIITSSSTVYKDGVTSAPKVGTKIIATGKVDADGTSLDATQVFALKLPSAGTGRPGGPGGPGGGPHFGGGPGGPHSGGPWDPQHGGKDGKGGTGGTASPKPSSTPTTTS